MQKALYVVSDLHLGTGQLPQEDFRADRKFGDFLRHITNDFSTCVELLVLGDAFDFPQVLSNTNDQTREPDVGSSELESIDKIKKIISGHPVFFDNLKLFLSNGNTVRFIRGNHDVDLIWPGVQEVIRKAVNASCAADALVFEPSHVYRKNGVHLEHGNQYDSTNCFKNPDAPFVATTSTPKRLERCWGTYLVETVVNDFAERYHLINNIPELPQALCLALLDDVRFTAKQLASVLMVIARAGLPVGKLVKNVTLGPDSESHGQADMCVATSTEFLNSLNDEIRAAVEKRLDNEEFSQQFNSEIECLLNAEPLDSDILADKTEGEKTLGLFTKENRYMRAAEKILNEKQEPVDVVVFGHTHAAVHHNHRKLEVPFEKCYINSGTWTFTVSLNDPRNQGKSFKALHESGHRTQRLSFVKICFNEAGSPAAELHHFEDVLSTGG